MSITIANYSYRQLITGTAPASSLSGFSVLITEANVDSTFWDNVDNGGGDVRVSINEDGTSQLPLEIVLCNTSTDELIAWVRFPTYSTSARELYVFSGNTGQTQPAVTATYARNNVWQDYQLVFHGTGLVDSTGNITPTKGSGATQVTTGKFGSAYEFNGTNNARIDFVLPTNPASTATWTLQAWANVDSGASNETIIAIADKDVSNDQDRLIQTNNTTCEVSDFNGSGAQCSVTANSGVWNLYTYKLDQNITFSEASLSVNNGTPDTRSAGEDVTAFDRVTLGTTADSTAIWFLTGKVQEARLSYTALSDNFLASEYSNQDDPANFWTQSTPDDPSGGGGAVTEYDLTLSQGVYSLTGQTINLLTERAISLDQGIYSTTGAIFTFDYVQPSNYNFLLNAGTYLTTGEEIDLLAERLLAFEPAVYSTTGNDIGLTIERAISLDQGNYDVTGQPVNLLADRVLDLQQGSYTLTGRPITFSYIETNAYNLVLGQGSYSTIGSDFTFDYVVPNQYNITLASGSYSTTGDEVSLLVERMLTMGAGSYSSEGLPITALFHRQLTMDAGVYTTVGSSVSIAYSEFSGFEIGSYSISFVQTPVQAYYDDLLVNTTYKH
jgi:hypothetical protein